MAAKKVKKTEKPAKSAKKAEEENLGAATPAEDAEETKGGKDAGVSKDFSSIEPTGKFEVVEVAKDQFRMFNENGQAVSPVVERDEKTEHNKPALAKLIREARRSNALRRKREIAVPKGHEAK